MNVPQPTLAFGFGNLAMLGWLAVAAAPLLIHLWSRQRHREAPWAAMQFLLLAMRKNARRLQLQQWLLLALRTSLIALVVMAVAEPYGETLRAGGHSAPAHKVVVIDGSLSMAYRDGYASRFAIAKAAAIDLVQSRRAGDTFTVINMASPARIVVGDEKIDHAAIAAQIDALVQNHTVADLSAALDLALADLTDTANGSRVPMRCEVSFFTDLQGSTWHKTEESASHADDERSPNTAVGDQGIQGRLVSLCKDADVVIVDVGQTSGTNLAITRLSALDSLVTVNRDVVFDVAVQQFGSEQQSRCSVELFVDDVPVAEKSIDVPAGNETVTQFVHRFSSIGAHSVAVRATDDHLLVDNLRWMVVPVRESIRVLCIAGREGAASFVADALNPNSDDLSQIQPVVVSDGQFAELELAEFDCVMVCNVAQLTENEAVRLKRFANAGGGLVVFLGDRVNTASYNSLLASGDRPLLPARIDEAISQSQFGLDPLDYRHPIVTPFRGREKAGLLTTPVARYYRLDISQSPIGAQIAAATRGGDPLIVTTPFGRGRVALVATDASLSSIDSKTGEPWTIWPTWPSFLPIVRELLAFATSGRQHQWQQLVGEPLHGSASRASSFETVASKLQVARPDGQIALAAIQSSGNELGWTYDDTDVNGIYSLRGVQKPDSHAYAVNVDKAESDLSKVDPQDLPSEIVIQAPVQFASKNSTMAVASSAGWSGRLLSMALLIMVIESFLAWRFGRGRL